MGKTGKKTEPATKDDDKPKNPPPAPAGSQLMFDAASAPSLATMKAWLASPYRTVGVYVPVAPGTDDRHDKVQSNLTETVKGNYKNEATGNGNLKAQQYVIEAGSSLSVKGVSVTVEASASLTLKGATVDIQGSGPVNIKGAIINLG